MFDLCIKFKNLKKLFIIFPLNVILNVESAKIGYLFFKRIKSLFNVVISGVIVISN